jgi:hypothetical protein
MHVDLWKFSLPSTPPKGRESWFEVPNENPPYDPFPICIYVYIYIYRYIYLYIFVYIYIPIGRKCTDGRDI